MLFTIRQHTFILKKKILLEYKLQINGLQSQKAVERDCIFIQKKRNLYIPLKHKRYRQKDTNNKKKVVYLTCKIEHISDPISHANRNLVQLTYKPLTENSKCRQGSMCSCQLFVASVHVYFLSAI